MGAQATLFAPPQVTSCNPFLNAQPGFHSGKPKSWPTTMDRHSENPMHRHHYQQQQQQQQQQSLSQPYLQRYQQQSANMSQQQQRRTPQNHDQRQHQQKWQLHNHFHYRQRNNPSMDFTTPFLPQNTQPTIKAAHPEHKSFMMITPSIHNTSGIVKTTQQFSQQYHRSATPKPKALPVTQLPSPQLTPVKHTHNPRPISTKSSIPNMQYKVAPLTSVYKSQQNKLAERAWLEGERQQRKRQYNMRRKELKSDGNALYHSYNEFLWYFPLGRGERSNIYLAGLLANQSMPAEPNSDRGLAIQYAKKNWQCYWELKDLKYVIQQAQEYREKVMAQQQHTPMDGTHATRL
ncbi:uncharacterized protein EKO05_0000907 [Ascochyta rabiei]|uniref:Uncharacterized protein n=1 Tax=Didymella rabiei TaxID=5454 RepID=A0A163MJ66_DIDRA|nr:uncharacterized protein EKO05_0000907 [Ascochyta rabiei]KZM28765.1 hypothetical protein ST47_g95 [Ascochyta rabiei]UPX10239.1 hypothetical protein EKO05_0000907 [Ascochyta rabiei]